MNPINCKYNYIVIERSFTIKSWNMILGFKCCIDHPSTSTLMCNDRVSFPWEIWKIPVKPVLKVSIILAKRMCNIRSLTLPYDQFIFTYSNITYWFLCSAYEYDKWEHILISSVLIYFWGIVFSNIANNSFEEIFLSCLNILWTIMFSYLCITFFIAKQT